jgi:23S rRNA (cytosine1962-C5)-methyltransferase
LRGTDYQSALEQLCQDGFLSIEGVLPVPQDLTGYSETRVTPPPVDPSPFNHPTKIVIVKIKRK